MIRILGKLPKTGEPLGCCQFKCTSICLGCEKGRVDRSFCRKILPLGKGGAQLQTKPDGPSGSTLGAEIYGIGELIGIRNIAREAYQFASIL